METIRAMMFGMNVPRLGRSCVDRNLINRIPSKFLLEASLITLILNSFGSYCIFFLVYLKKGKETNERNEASSKEKIGSRR